MEVDLRRFFDVIGDSTRLRLVGLLALRPHGVEELARLLETKPAVVSRHLSRLEGLGLVAREREGRRLRYRLRTALLVEWSRQLAATSPKEPAPEVGDEEGWERRLLASLLVDHRLEQVPAQRKKRLVVLHWLAEHFRPGERYSEAQVNDIIRRYHDDPALLRRLMVDEELMQRAAGLYWRAGTLPPPAPAGLATPPGADPEPPA